MLALLLAAATPQTAVEAERAFAAAAQELGQWTAFRTWAAADATMFLPQRSSAQAFLAPLADPPKSVEWQPAESYVSCDGTTAANTGPTRWPNGKVGYFSTIWRQQAGTWRWTVDHGDFTAAPRWRWGGDLTVSRASCRTPVVPLPPRLPAPGIDLVERRSPDGTLVWSASVRTDGARWFEVRLWDGATFRTVIRDQVGAR